MQQIPSKHAPGRVASPAVTIRRLVVPQVAPPYDDEEGSSDQEGNGGRLAGPAVLAPGPAHLEVPQYRATIDNPIDPGSGDDGADRCPAATLPAGRWPGQFAQVLAETLAGSRPCHQLTAWTTERARRQIRQLSPLLATGERPLVRRVMTSAPASGVLELTAVVGFGPRVRALALRLEREPAGRGWRCTAVESA
ncbi:MAG TPA: Rv3235 family protein [Streptosporangiaceae bacterium]|nr:Rv3235 family protein [Streptosporangiaceae bacterium]